jgi:hypothetical protein
MKIRLMEAELFHVDRRTDMTKLTVIFRSFAKHVTCLERLLEKRHFEVTCPFLASILSFGALSLL